MGRNFRLGSAFEVEIAVDSSWVFALIFATGTLVSVAGHVLASTSSAVVTLVGAGAAIGVFASLVVHGLAQALAVRACGVPVRRLTLFVFGGLTDVERAPASPRSDAVAALIAPLSNALVGGVLLVAAAAIGDSFEALALLVRWLGVANLAIAALVFVPAFPLDGGRLLRAALWRATGDVERATRWSAWIGQATGWSVVVAGVVLAFASHGDRVAAAMSIVFAGWFVTSGAAKAYAMVARTASGLDGAGWHQGALES